MGGRQDTDNQSSGEKVGKAEQHIRLKFLRIVSKFNEFYFKRYNTE